jgi:hypothetical protein
MKKQTRSALFCLFIVTGLVSTHDGAWPVEKSPKLPPVRIGYV